MERIAVLEAQVANLTSTVVALSQNIDAANTKVMIVTPVTATWRLSHLSTDAILYFVNETH